MKKNILYGSVVICIFLLSVTFCFADTDSNSSSTTNNMSVTTMSASFNENTTELTTDELKNLLNEVNGLFEKGHTEFAKYRNMDSVTYGEARKEFIIPVLDAYKLLIDNDIPEVENSPDFPMVWVFDILPNGSPRWHAAMREYEKQMLLRQKAEVFDKLISVKLALKHEILGCYHEKPYKIEEFRQLLKEKIIYDSYINIFMLEMNDDIAREELEKKVNNQQWKKR